MDHVFHRCYIQHLSDYFFVLFKRDFVDQWPWCVIPNNESTFSSSWQFDFIHNLEINTRAVFISAIVSACSKTRVTASIRITQQIPTSYRIVGNKKHAVQRAPRNELFKFLFNPRCFQRYKCFLNVCADLTQLVFSFAQDTIWVMWKLLVDDY